MTRDGALAAIETAIETGADEQTIARLYAELRRDHPAAARELLHHLAGTSVQLKLEG